MPHLKGFLTLTFIYFVCQTSTAGKILIKNTDKICKCSSNTPKQSSLKLSIFSTPIFTYRTDRTPTMKKKKEICIFI